MKAFLITAGAALLFAAVARADTWRIHLTSAGQATARAAVLKRADLGASGWTGGSVKPDLTSTPPCTSFRPKQSDLVVVGAAETRWKQSAIQVDDQATALQTPQMVALDWQRTVLDPRAEPCLRSGLDKQIGATGKVVSFGRVAFPKLGTFTRMYRGVIEVQANGQTVRIDTDVILIGKKNVELSLTVVAPSLARTVDNQAERTLARRMASRVR